MHTAIFILNCIAVVFALVWFYECTQYRQDVLERKHAATLAAAKPAKAKVVNDPDVPNLLKKRLNQPYEKVQEQFDFYRSLKSPDYAGLRGADKAKLSKTMDDNEKLKKFCKDQIQIMKDLKDSHTATKTRLAWFEEWYPKLHSAYEKRVKNGGQPGQNTDAFQNYAKDAKKAFYSLKSQHEATKVVSKMRLAASADNKNAVIVAKEATKTAQQCLTEAELEIGRLQDLQKVWQTKKRSLEAEVKKLTIEKHLLETQPRRPGSRGSGSPIMQLPSRMDMFDQIDEEDYTKRSRNNSTSTSSQEGYRSMTGEKRAGSLDNATSQISWSDGESELGLMDGEDGLKIEYSFF